MDDSIDFGEARVRFDAAPAQMTAPGLALPACAELWLRSGLLLLTCP
jgi:hypothetical protein